MALTNGVAEPEPIEPEEDKQPPEAKASKQEPEPELLQLRERIAKMEGEFTGIKRENDQLKTALISRNNAPPADRAENIQEMVDKLMTESPYQALNTYTLKVLDPIITKIIGERDKKSEHLMELLARKERNEVARELSDVDEGDKILSRIDSVMERLTLDERAEPGAYWATYEEIRKEEELAELRMNSAGRSTKVHTRGRQEPVEDEDQGYTDEELRWAKRSGMSIKEFKKWQESEDGKVD